MNSEDEFEEISRFLDQESGSILTNVAQDLIQESYGTCWTSEADFFHEFGSLQSYPETSLQYEVDYAIHEQIQNGPAQMEMVQDWSSLNIPINNYSEVEMLPEGIPEVVEETENVEAAERELIPSQPNPSKDPVANPPKLPSRRFDCSDCGSSYSRKSDLTRHKKEKHSKDSLDVAEFFCPYCLDRFGRRQNCIRHLKRCDLVPSGLSATEIKEPLTEFPG